MGLKLSGDNWNYFAYRGFSPTYLSPPDPLSKGVYVVSSPLSQQLSLKGLFIEGHT